jgi:hypothetical protein
MFSFMGSSGEGINWMINHVDLLLLLRTQDCCCCVEGEGEELVAGHMLELRGILTIYVRCRVDWHWHLIDANSMVVRVPEKSRNKLDQHHSISTHTPPHLCEGGELLIRSRSCRSMGILPSPSSWLR